MQKISIVAAISLAIILAAAFALGAPAAASFGLHQAQYIILAAAAIPAVKPELFTIADVCRVLAIHETTVYTLIARGELTAIKRSYGKNTVRIEYEGDGDFLNQPSVVRSLNRFGAVTEAKLVPGADAQEILKAAVAGGVRINRFELVEPPLNDIFIEKVSGAHAQTVADHQA